MKCVVFGANGKVGSLVTERLLEEGVEVRAFIHGNNNLSDNPLLEIFPGDVYSAQEVTEAIKNVDAVISCLGSWGTKQKNILTAGMQHIIPAMENAGLNRIVTLTGHDARAKGDKLSLLHRLSHSALSIIASKVLRDGEDHIKLLELSSLDWTVVRSPVMTNSKKREYKLRNSRPWPLATIPRSGVVTAMVDQLKRRTEVKTAVFISR